MLELFGVAAVLVSPFAVVTIRRIQRDRAARVAAATVAAATRADGAAPEARSGIGDAAPGADLGAVVVRLRAEALAHTGGEWFDLTVPARVTLDGRPAEPRLTVRLVVDDLRRSGLEVRSEGADGGSLRCRRV